MMTEEANRSILIDSSLEFVITGPAGRSNRILVKSASCDLDLLGFSQESDVEALRGLSGSNRYSLGLLQWFSRPMQLVKSSPKPTGSWAEDDRDSNFRFCWVGHASARDREEIQKIFDRHAIDLDKGIEHGNKEEVEWAIASTVYGCSSCDRKRRSMRRNALLLSALYLLIALISLGIWLAWNFHRVQLK